MNTQEWISRQMERDLITAVCLQDDMSDAEAAYWHGEISDADLNREADAGDFILAAQALINPDSIMSLDESEALRRYMVDGQWPAGWESWGEVAK